LRVIEANFRQRKLFARSTTRLPDLTELTTVEACLEPAHPAEPPMPPNAVALLGAQEIPCIRRLSSI